MLLQSLPRMARPLGMRELSVWALMAIPNGVLSGGVAGVLASAIFASSVPAWVIAIAVALLTGAGPLANVGSLGWAHWSLGRPKVRAVNQLQLGFAVALVIAALAPVGPWGLLQFVGAIISAQFLWSGIITVRAGIWRLNYDRATRFAFAADNQAIVSLIHAVTAGVTGWLIGASPETFRWLLILTALCAIGSLFRLRGLKVRRELRLLSGERIQAGAGHFSLNRYLDILRQDRLFRRYMICMMVLGSGNLMFSAPLILIMTRHLEMSAFSQILITAALPTAIVPFSARYWSRTLASQHVIGFRRLNSRWYAIAIGVAFLACLAGFNPLLYLAAIILGFAIGGGMLGWNLGHNDFASEDRAADYLGLHVSLTGLRGLLAPLVGVWLYGTITTVLPGREYLSLLLPLILTSIGSLGFVWFDHDHRKSENKQ